MNIFDRKAESFSDWKLMAHNTNVNYHTVGTIPLQRTCALVSGECMRCDQSYHDCYHTDTV